MNTDILERMRKIKIAVFDFDGVMTNNQVLVSEKGEEFVLCNRSDGMGLRLLVAEGIQPMILSTEVNPVVQARARKLKVPCVSGCLDKGTALRELARERNVSLAELSFVGNDANDLEALHMVGLGVAVGDAYPEVKAAAKIILERNGGYGAVREFCEKICRARRALAENESPWYMPDLVATYASPGFQGPSIEKVI